MTRSRKSSFGAAAAAALVLVLSSCGGGQAGGTAADSIESMDPITLTYTAVSPEKSAGAIAFDEFMTSEEARREYWQRKFDTHEPRPGGLTLVR